MKLKLHCSCHTLGLRCLFEMSETILLCSEWSSKEAVSCPHSWNDSSFHALHLLAEQALMGEPWSRLEETGAALQSAQKGFNCTPIDFPLSQPYILKNKVVSAVFFFCVCCLQSHHCLWPWNVNVSFSVCLHCLSSAGQRCFFKFCFQKNYAWKIIPDFIFSVCLK